METINPVDSLVGANVARARQQAGLSHDACANYLGLSVAEYISKEHGSRRFRAEHLFMLSRKFELPLARFYKPVER